MKPFDLQKALAGEKVITRDGRPVKIAGYNEDAFESEKVAGWLGGSCVCWNLSGKLWSDREHDEDLFMAPTERVEWVVVWTNTRGDRCAQVFREESGAKFLFDQLVVPDEDPTIHKITISE